MLVNASAYSYSYNDELAGHLDITKSGKKVAYGMVAVDPKVIPLGTKMRIEGFGNQVFVAEDTGSAIKGNKIDIFLPTRQQMIQFGRRNLKIYILD